MAGYLNKLFDDRLIVERIQRKMPYLFQLAETESSRAGKTDIEVGSVREKIIVALLIYKFGEANVETEIPITEPEVDVRLFGEPVSIKTITGKGLSGVKLIWTVDAQKAKEFGENYYPHCDILFVQINWNDTGGFYSIPLAAQKRLFDKSAEKDILNFPNPEQIPEVLKLLKRHCQV